jgi:hypothetical protein
MGTASNRRSGATKSRPALDCSAGVTIRIGGEHDIVATTVICATAAGVSAVPTAGTTDARRIALGRLPDDSDTVLVAWSVAPPASAPPIDLVVEQRGWVLDVATAHANVAADVPEQVTGVQSVYVLRHRVRAGELSLMSPPPGSTVSLDSIVAWVAATPA